jgi:hypothetical protein
LEEPILQVPLAAHRGRRDAVVGAQLAALIEGLDWMRLHARRVVAPEAVSSCGKVNQVQVWRWQIVCDVLCSARGPTEPIRFPMTLIRCGRCRDAIAEETGLPLGA